MSNIFEVGQTQIEQNLMMLIPTTIGKSLPVAPLVR